MPLLYLRDATQLQNRLSSSLVCSHARAPIVVDVHREMAIELGRQIPIQTVSVEVRPHPRQRRAQSPHDHASLIPVALRLLYQPSPYGSSINPSPYGSSINPSPYGSSGAKNLAMIPVVCCHSRASFASCLRPARVRA